MRALELVGILSFLAGCPVVAERAPVDTAGPDDSGNEVDSGDPAETGDSDSGAQVETGDSGCEEFDWYADTDRDGFGSLENAFRACEPPIGYTADDSDCDDTRADVYPGAPETCEGTDQNCDTTVDNEAVDAPIWFADLDGDGWGAVSSGTIVSCTAPADMVATDSDCDDDDVGIYPGAAERCDETDEDCDEVVDNDALDADRWFADNDGDGHGDADIVTYACEAPPNSSADDLDCDDDAAEVFPGADEYCDGVDEDCDGNIDETPVDPVSYYLDIDGDGFGTKAAIYTACSSISGYVSFDSDCDDTDDAVYPGALDGCDGLDSDCDGEVDEADSFDAGTWYLDADGDGYAGTSTTTACSQPVDHYASIEDCDDANGRISPAAGELCGGTDENCDGTTDEDSAIDAPFWHADVDADGYGDPVNTYAACALPSGYTTDTQDCDDSDPASSPIGTDSCSDGLDQDCDGDPDDGCWPTGSVDVVTGRAQIYGTGASLYLGSAIGAVGDLTGDGNTDFVVSSGGAPGKTLYVLDALATGVHAAPGSTVLATRTMTYNAPSPGAGDFNGDGADDLVYGDIGQGTSGVEYGPITGTSGDSRDITLGTYLTPVATGDIDDDGIDDLVGGASGKACIFASTAAPFGNGASGSCIWKSGGSGSIGSAVDAGKDFDGDGVHDFVVGGSQSIWIFTGPSWSSGTSGADYTITADATAEPQFGSISVALAHDANGDGYGEVATGSYGDNGGVYGREFVFNGDIAGTATTADAYATIEADGTLLALAYGMRFADVDGDGKEDLLTSGSAYGVNTIGIFLSPFSGTHFGADADTVLYSPTGTWLGSDGTLNLGDIEGFGYDAIAFSDQRDDVGATDAGAVFTFYGP